MKKVALLMVALFLMINTVAAFADETTVINIYGKEINGKITNTGLWNLYDEKGNLIREIDLINKNSDSFTLKDGKYTIKQIKAKSGYQIDPHEIKVELPAFNNGHRVSTYTIYTKPAKEIEIIKPKDPEPEPEPRKPDRPDRPRETVYPDPKKPDPDPYNPPPVIEEIPPVKELPPPPSPTPRPYHTGVNAYQIPFLLMAVGASGMVIGTLGLKKQ